MRVDHPDTQRLLVFQHSVDVCNIIYHKYSMHLLHLIGDFIHIYFCYISNMFV